MPISGLIVLIFGIVRHMTFGKISDALFSNSQARLYPWLFGQPQRAFHLNELRRLSGLGSASLQRELNRLVGAGLVDDRAVGNLRQFQANPSAPVFGELVALTGKTLGLVPIIKAALQSLQPPPLAAWVYGSVARHTDTAHSDIDLMLVGEHLRLGDVLAALEPAQQQLARSINPTCYTLADFARRQAEPDSFVNRVLAQATLPLIGNAHGLASAG